MIKSLVLGGELADVLLYGFDAAGQVDLRAELTGESTFLVDAAGSSAGRTSFYGAVFRLGELSRISVAAFHDGMLADVADATMQLGLEPPPQLKVYSVAGVRLGLVVDDDIDCQAVWSRLIGECDGIVGITRTFNEERAERVEELQRLYSLPAVVRCGGQLYAYGAKEAKLYRRED